MLFCRPCAAQLTTTQEIYERAISALFREDVDMGRPRTVYVANSSDTLARLPDSSHQARSWDNVGPRLVWGDVSLQLRKQFRDIVGHSNPVAAANLPPNVVLGGGKNSRRTLVSLSPIAFAPDSGQALVYVGVHCGGLCGGADIVYLRKANTGWIVAATFPMWRS
jgi:hypothetical protein